MDIDVYIDGERSQLGNQNLAGFARATMQGLLDHVGSGGLREPAHRRRSSRCGSQKAVARRVDPEGDVTFARNIGRSWMEVAAGGAATRN